MISNTPIFSHTQSSFNNAKIPSKLEGFQKRSNQPSSSSYRQNSLDISANQVLCILNFRHKHQKAKCIIKDLQQFLIASFLLECLTILSNNQWRHKLGIIIQQFLMKPSNKRKEKKKEFKFAYKYSLRRHSYLLNIIGIEDLIHIRAYFSFYIFIRVRTPRKHF